MPARSISLQLSMRSRRNTAEGEGTEFPPRTNNYTRGISPLPDRPAHLTNKTEIRGGNTQIKAVKDYPPFIHPNYPQASPSTLGAISPLAKSRVTTILPGNETAFLAEMLFSKHPRYQLDRVANRCCVDFAAYPCNSLSFKPLDYFNSV